MPHIIEAKSISQVMHDHAMEHGYKQTGTHKYSDGSFNHEYEHPEHYDLHIHHNVKGKAILWTHVNSSTRKVVEGKKPEDLNRFLKKFHNR